jgi:hypothetical protein
MTWGLKQAGFVRVLTRDRCLGALSHQQGGVGSQHMAQQQRCVASGFDTGSATKACQGKIFGVDV